MKQSESLVRLNQLDEADGFPAYVAIYSERAALSPFLLSPNVMQWSDEILLCKVDDCEKFWLAQKQKLGGSLNELFEQVLANHFGSDYVAVFANHPWQCLVYLNYQVNHRGEDRNVQRSYFLQSLLNRNIYKSLDWQFWFAPQQKLAEHLDTIKARRFNAATFRAKQSQLKRFINRIGVSGPFDLKQLDYHAITRRFGVWTGNIWSWTFHDCPELDHFPWLALAEPPRPTVQRELEYPLNQWSYIEVLLREDFERLCTQFDNNESEHINLMNWQITLFNYQVIDVELSFRHPYSLHRELPEFKTALYQAWYVYENLMRELQRRDKDLDLPESMPFIAWQVEVCERIYLAPVIWDLFENDNDLKLPELYDLQNKLPVSIEAYSCEANFYPEQSFEAISPGAINEPGFDDYQWSSSSIDRPLFYYSSAREIETPVIKPRQFLERCASRWWLVEDIENQIKDYYVIKDGRGRASWVYRDYRGRWFKQGEYS